MNKAERSQKLGKAIFDYFIQRTSPNETFKLCIDKYIYEYCAKQAGLTELDMKKVLLGFDILHCYEGEYIALSIASLEVVVAYSIEAATDLANSYNPWFLKKVILVLRDNNKLQKFYTRCQDYVWTTVKNLFQKKNRNLDIPNPHEGPYRYVQYPLGQRILSGTDLLKYADRFRAIHLEPHQAITYQLFTDLVFYRNQYADEEEKRRLVFSFYCVWDGRSSEEIKNNTRELTEKEREQKVKDEFLIKLEPQVEMYINKEKVNLQEDDIPEKFLFLFESQPYPPKKGYVFIKDNDYNDWLPNFGTISEDEEILILTKRFIIPNYLQNYINNEKLEVIPAGNYFIFHLMLERDDFISFGIKLKQKPYISFVGGIKSKRNTYFSFALPVIKLSEEMKNIKVIYVDSKSQEVIDGVVKLPEDIEQGKHWIKIFDSWKSSEMFFSIDDETLTKVHDVCGWHINYKESELNPVTGNLKMMVEGKYENDGLNWIERSSSTMKIVNTSYRQFELQNERLVDRFEKIGNIRISRRSKYGY
ncbi:hypothetical protein [uncultured Treponema sp.]|uniref:hypothetical protein n=1 Tax=uncultured Treponema sp. TaxID=162155 RepID=UPI0027D9CA84|nr:hypothetical protein [uncultured Treponema sp.]